MKEAYSRNAAFFDTAERYGSHLKTIFGLGWGETESFLKKILNSEIMNNESTKFAYGSPKNLLGPVVATKFTPSPWRRTVESVVDACEQSRQRLGVDQIDVRNKFSSVDNFVSYLLKA